MEKKPQKCWATLIPNLSHIWPAACGLDISALDSSTPTPECLVKYRIYLDSRTLSCIYKLYPDSLYCSIHWLWFVLWSIGFFSSNIHEQLSLFHFSQWRSFCSETHTLSSSLFIVDTNASNLNFAWEVQFPIEAITNYYQLNGLKQYGLMTVNSGGQNLKQANWVSLPVGL